MNLWGKLLRTTLNSVAINSVVKNHPNSVAQWIKVPSAKPDNLCSIIETHTVISRTECIPANCPLNLTHVLWNMHAHMHMHTHTND